MKTLSPTPQLKNKVLLKYPLFTNTNNKIKITNKDKNQKTQKNLTDIKN